MLLSRFGPYLALTLLFAVLCALIPDAMGELVLGLLRNAPMWSAATILIGVPVHEAGHALVAACLGYRVLAIQIGTGPRLFSFRLRSVTVAIHALPLGGAMHSVPGAQLGWMRLRLWLVVAGGPGANLLLHLILRRLQLGDWSGGPIGTALTIAVHANLFLLVTNLIPFKTAEGNFSDGYKLLTIPLWNRARVEELCVAAQLHDTQALIDRGQVPEAEALLRELELKQVKPGLAKLQRGLLLHRSRRHQEARAVWTDALGQVDDPLLAATIRNNIAYMNVLLGGQANVDAADRLSTEAFAVMPGAASIMGTRGAVMVRLGRYAHALPLLRRALEADRNPQDRAATNAFLAMAQARLGGDKAARRHLAEARALDPACGLLVETAAVVAAAAGQVPAPGQPVDLDQVALPAVAVDAVAHWRGKVRALILLTSMVLPFVYPIVAGATPILLMLVLLVYPERATLRALASAMLMMALLSALGLGGMFEDDQRLLGAVVGGVSGGLAWWLCRGRIAPEVVAVPQVARVTGVLLGALSLLFLVFAIRLLTALPAARALVQLGTWVMASALLVATATVMLDSPRRGLSSAGLVPATAAVFLVVLALSE